MELTGFNSSGDINIPILARTTNEQMSQAILNAFTSRLNTNVVKRTRELKEYITGLNTHPRGLFFDPCYETCEDAFVANFSFNDYED